MYWVKIYAVCFVAVSSAFVITAVQSPWVGFETTSASGISLLILGGAMLAIPVLLVVSILEPLLRYLQPRFSMKFVIGCAFVGVAAVFLTPVLLSFMSSRSLPNQYVALDALALIPFGALGGLVFGLIARKIGTEEI